MHHRFNRAVLCVLIVCGVASAHHTRYVAHLAGNEAVPPNASLGHGHVVVAVDFDLAVMEIEAEFSGLLGAVTAAHIHAATAEAGHGIADVAAQLPSLLGFPLASTTGTYDQSFDLADGATYNPAFFTATGGTISTAMNALLTAFEEGKAYFDIHTSEFADGEIRGFFTHVPGDFNLNGEAEAADYVVWRSTLGDIGDGLVADANQSSVIDPGDIAIWREHFGETGHHHEEASAALGLAAVPEPSASLGWAAFVCMSSLRRRR